MDLLLEIQPRMDNKDLDKLDRLMEEIMKHKKLLLKEGKPIGKRGKDKKVRRKSGYIARWSKR